MSSPKFALVRPEPGEYASFYETYVSKVQGGDVLSQLESQRLQTAQLFAASSERDGNFRYAPSKWTIKEVVGHLSDTERVFSYRALRIARGDQTPLPGFEQDDYVKNGNFAEQSLADLVLEFGLVRASTLALLRSFSAEAWARRGTASNNPITVRALAFIIAGHELHHREILKERYFPAIPRA
jgi:DinB family protein